MNFRPRREEEVDVNLTPLIDVVFLLLIFFMVSTTFIRESEIESDDGNPIVIISADAAATHQSVVTVMDAARQAGLTRITFPTKIHEE